MSENREVFRFGDPYIECQRTGFKVRKSETVIETRTRLRVLRGHDDPEHPQDHIRSKRDKQVFRGNISESEDTFLGTNEITAAALVSRSRR